MKYNIKSWHDDERKETINQPVFLLTTKKIYGVGDFGTASFQPVYLHTTKNGIPTYSHYLGHGEELILSDFSVSALFNTKDVGLKGIKSLFSYSCGYDNQNLSVDNLYCAKVRISLIEKLSKGLSKLYEHFGRPTNFPQYVCYVAHVVGINRFIIQTKATFPAEYKTIEKECLDAEILSRMKELINDN